MHDKQRRIHQLGHTNSAVDRFFLGQGRMTERVILRRSQSARKQAIRHPFDHARVFRMHHGQSAMGFRNA